MNHPLNTDNVTAFPRPPDPAAVHAAAVQALHRMRRFEKDLAAIEDLRRTLHAPPTPSRGLHDVAVAVDALEALVRLSARLAADTAPSGHAPPPALQAAALRGDDPESAHALAVYEESVRAVHAAAACCLAASLATAAEIAALGRRALDLVAGHPPVAGPLPAETAASWTPRAPEHRRPTVVPAAGTAP